MFPITYVTTFCVGGADRKETLMEQIVIKLTRQVKRHFRRTISKTKDAKLKTRYTIILHTAEGHSRRNIAQICLGKTCAENKKVVSFGTKRCKDRSLDSY